MGDDATHKRETFIPKTKDDFLRIPWCAALLNAPGIKSFVLPRWDPAVPDAYDDFFGRTLQSPHGIPIYLGFCPAEPTDGLVAECGVLFSLGRGLKGHWGPAHGAIVAGILDQAMGILVGRNVKPEALGVVDNGKIAEVGSPFFRTGAVVTGNINLQFKRPVSVPGVVLVRAKIGEIKDRKMVVLAVLRDADGAELASCESTWHAVPMDMQTKL